MTDTKMPFGITGKELSKRMATNISATEDQKALAEKLGVSEHLITALNRFPHFMAIQYDFSSLVDILELEFTKLLEANVRFRKCKRCGKYFIMKGN